MNNVHISSYNQDEHLIERLQDLLKYVDAVANYMGVINIFLKIEAVDDHKGRLTVVWSDYPTNQEKSFFDRGWADYIGEEGQEVIHTHTDEESKNPTISLRKTD